MAVQNAEKPTPLKSAPVSELLEDGSTISDIVKTDLDAANVEGLGMIPVGNAMKSDEVLDGVPFTFRRARKG